MWWTRGTVSGESNASSPIDPRYTRRPQPQPQPTPGRYLSATRHMYLLDIAALSSRAPPASPTRTRTRLQLPHSLTPKARTLSQATNDSEMEALRKARRSAFQHHPVSRSLAPLNTQSTQRTLSSTNTQPERRSEHVCRSFALCRSPTALPWVSQLRPAQKHAPPSALHCTRLLQARVQYKAPQDGTQQTAAASALPRSS